MKDVLAHLVLTGRSLSFDSHVPTLLLDFFYIGNPVEDNFVKGPVLD